MASVSDSSGAFKIYSNSVKVALPLRTRDSSIRGSIDEGMVNM